MRYFSTFILQAASCAFMIFWTGVSAVVQFAIAGKIGGYWIGLFIAIGFVDAQIGQRFVYWFIGKYKRPSIIVILLAMVIILAIIGLTINQSITIYESWTTVDDMFSNDNSWTLCSYYQ